MVLFVTLSIKDFQHNDTWHKHKLSVVMLNLIFSYCYAECHSAECRGAPFEGRARGLNQKYKAWLKLVP